jgi:NADH-quinone oxidoreductase subunit M
LIGLFTKGDDARAQAEARYIALFTTLVTFAASLLLWVQFDKSSAEFQFVEKVEWFSGLNISYHMGVDGISLFMVLLTTLLMPICILCSWESITTRTRAFMVNFLVLEDSDVSDYRHLGRAEAHLRGL